MSDLISRQAAIDAIESAFDRETILNRFVRKIAISAVRMLPSAQSEQRWILCDQRMPEEREWIGTRQFGTTISDEVYVTFEAPDGQRFAKHISFQNGKLSNYDQRTIDVLYKGSIPIAWMPLPEPYKEEP